MFYNNTTMDEPRTSTKKPVDELLKDLYGPSDDSVGGQPAPASQSVDRPSESVPADLHSPQPSEETNFWPPVPPIAGINKDKSPWEDSVEPLASQGPKLTEPSASEINYPNRRFFRRQ